MFHPAFRFSEFINDCSPLSVALFFLLVFSGTVIVGLDEVGILGPEGMQGPLGVLRKGYQITLLPIAGNCGVRRLGNAFKKTETHYFQSYFSFHIFSFDSGHF